MGIDADSFLLLNQTLGAICSKKDSHLSSIPLMTYLLLPSIMIIPCIIIQAIMPQVALLTELLIMTLLRVIPILLLLI
jgi:hypothetical protein